VGFLWHYLVAILSSAIEELCLEEHEETSPDLSIGFFFTQLLLDGDYWMAAGFEFQSSKHTCSNNFPVSVTGLLV